jgi:hypothetical protein
MNLKHSILAAGLALGLTGAASAANVTYISGSTAFRGAANSALATYCGAHGGSSANWASDNTNITSAGNLLLTYTNGTGLQYVIVHWNGSEAGNQSAAGPAEGASNAATVGFWATNVSTGWTNTATDKALATNKHVSAAAFSDTYQSTSIFNGTVKGVTYANLKGYDLGDGIVGAVAFSWVGSAGIPTNANITASSAQNLFAANNEPLALITGNAADQTNSVFLVGRNVDSGTRLTTLAETGYGVKTGVNQYAVGTNFTGSSNSTVTLTGTNATNELFLYPVETINGISSGSVGNSGYSSGGTLCGLMNFRYAQGSSLLLGNFNSSNTAITSTTAWSRTGSNFLVGYAGVSDAYGKTNGTSNTLVLLAYNGTQYSTNAIIQGQYTFWGYEHLYYGNNANPTDVAFIQAFGAALESTPTSTLFPNVNYDDLNASVGRNGDGLPVYPQY